MKKNTKNLLLSKEWYDRMKADAIRMPTPLDIDGIKIIPSPALPYEQTYPACDLSTKEEVKILSGELIHAVLIPEYNYELEPLTMEWDSSFKNHSLFNARLNFDLSIWPAF